MLVGLGLSTNSAHLAREAVSDTLVDLGRADLVDDATLVVSELVANGVLHARTAMTLSVERAGEGVRVAVSDGSHLLPQWTPASPAATSGRGLLLVERLSSNWGAERLAAGGKVVWAQIDRAAPAAELTHGELLDLWSDDPATAASASEATIDVTVDIDVTEMLESRAHTEDLVRELQLTLLNDTCRVTTRTSPPELVQLARRLDSATDDFHDARRQMLHQTLSAAQSGRRTATLNLKLHPGDAGAARRWLDALSEADALTSAGILLLPPFPAAMTAFRHCYIEAIIKQLEASHP